MNISCVIQWDVRENRYWQSFISSISYFFLIFSPDLALTWRLWDIANKEVANCIKHGTGHLSFYKWHQDSECRQLPCCTKMLQKHDYLQTAFLIDCCCILLCHLPDFGFKFSFLFIFFKVLLFSFQCPYLYKTLSVLVSVLTIFSDGFPH